MDTRDAFTIAEFCSRNGISRSLLYKLWDAGKGPRRMSVGARTLISREAAEEWRRAREAETASKKEAA